MRKRLFIGILLLSILLAGCENRIQTAAIAAVPASHESDKREMDRDLKIPEGDWNEDLALEGQDSPEAEEPVPAQTVPAQPGPSKGEKMDFNALNQVDNKSYAWWIQLNKKHEPTGIPPYARRIINDCQGVYIGDTSKKVVYLTFDEGYENGYTPLILDTLKKNDVKALFFVTGPFVDTNGDLVKRMLDEGHQVGNHTIHHLSLPTLTPASMEKELYGLEKKFTALTGKGFKYMRPPRGEYSARVLSAAKQLGYTTVFWSFAYDDYDTDHQKGPDHAYQKVMDNLHNGEVLLLHAVSSDNAQALDKIIKGIKAEGYTIAPFDF